MRVLQLLPELNAGGVETGTLEIARSLVQAGHESIVISAGGRLVKSLKADGSRHIPLPIHKKGSDQSDKSRRSALFLKRRNQTSFTSEAVYQPGSPGLPGAKCPRKPDRGLLAPFTDSTLSTPTPKS